MLATILISLVHVHNYDYEIFSNCFQCWMQQEISPLTRWPMRLGAGWQEVFTSSRLGANSGLLQCFCSNTTQDSTAAISVGCNPVRTFSNTSSVMISSWLLISHATRPFSWTVLEPSMYCRPRNTWNGGNDLVLGSLATDYWDGPPILTNGTHGNLESQKTGGLS